MRYVTFTAGTTPCKGLDIPMGAITLQKDQDGRETGECYVNFPSTQDAEKALAKDRQHMGHR